MFTVYAAEQQYRHETWSREREHALLAAIRERSLPPTPPRRTARVVSRSSRTTWARPIGLRPQAECVACA